MIPIIGGDFEGPRLRGEVVSGGADEWLNRTILLGTLDAPGRNPDEVVIRFFEAV